MLCAASPIPASSGKTTRHRLNYGGDRQANRALHLIAVCRMRYCERTRAYVTRRTAEGKTKRDIIRCLKRYIAREVYNTLRADLAELQPQPQPRPTTTIMCGAPGFGITRTRPSTSIATMQPGLSTGKRSPEPIKRHVRRA